MKANKTSKIRDLAKDAAFLIVIFGEIRGIALKHVGCTDDNVEDVNNWVDIEIETIKKEIEE